MAGKRVDKPNDLANSRINGKPNNKSEKSSIAERYLADNGALISAINTRVHDEISRAHPDSSVKPLNITAYQLIEALTKGDRAFLVGLVDAVIHQNIEIYEFYDTLIAPTTAYIGESWLDDNLDFLTIEMISLRLQMMCNQLSERLSALEAHQDNKYRVLFARIDGEQHLLGLSIVDLLFRHEGWHVSGGVLKETDRAYFKSLMTEHFDLVGLSVGAASFERISQIVQKTRAYSLNKDIKIAIGGPMIAHNTSDFLDIGADLMSSNAKSAVQQANRLIAAG